MLPDFYRISAYFPIQLKDKQVGAEKVIAALCLLCMTLCHVQEKVRSKELSLSNTTLLPHYSIHVSSEKYKAIKKKLADLSKI